MPESWISSPSTLPTRDFEQLRRCLTVFRKAADASRLDLSSLSFMDPAAMVLLYHFASAKSDGRALQVLLPEQPAARKIFDLHHGFWSKKDQGELRLKSNAVYPLRYIREEDRIVEELTEWRRQIMELGALEEEAARALSATLSEVLTNSFSHGADPTRCIVAGQTFKKRPHTQIASVDFGRTIPTTLRESGRYPGERSEGEWIRLSLERGVTCRSRESNKGLGLYMLSEQVRRAKGTLMIASGNGAILSKVGGPVRYCELGPGYEALGGTLIVVDLPTDFPRK